jgi:protein arginine kinase
MDLALIPDGGLAWLEASGPLAHVVLSTRIRLARNLEHAVFAGRASSEQRRRVLEAVDVAWPQCASARGGSRILLDDLDGAERQVLHERHLVSKELMASAEGRPGRSASAVFLAGSLGVMVNEEDHLRLQTLHSGFALQAAFRLPPRVWLSYCLSDECGDGPARVGSHPPARAGAHEGDLEGPPGAFAGRSDLPRAVRRG